MQTFVYFPIPSRYALKPIVRNFSALTSTPSSMLRWYLTIFSWYSGKKEPRIRTASNAAFVELLMPTVATGTPLWKTLSFCRPLEVRKRGFTYRHLHNA